MFYFSGEEIIVRVWGRGAIAPLAPMVPTPWLCTNLQPVTAMPQLVKKAAREECSLLPKQLHMLPPLGTLSPYDMVGVHCCMRYNGQQD